MSNCRYMGYYYRKVACRDWLIAQPDHTDEQGRRLFWLVLQTGNRLAVLDRTVHERANAK